MNVTLIYSYLEHFEPTSLSLSEEVNFFGESREILQLQQIFLRCKAGEFALKRLEGRRLLSTLKGEVAARRALRRGGDGVHSCSRGCGTSGGRRGADTGR